MVSEPTPAVQDQGDSRARGPARADHLEALIAEVKTQHARYLTILEEALSTSAHVRRLAAEEAERVLSSARQDADRLRTEAIADREAAREERVRLAAARTEAEEALAHTRHALSVITAPLPAMVRLPGVPFPKRDERPEESAPPTAAASEPASQEPVSPEPPQRPPAVHDRPILGDTHTGTEADRRRIGSRVLLAAVVPPCLLLLGVFASMTWRNGSANGTPRPLHASQLPALSYLPVSAPVSRPPVTARPAFTLTASRPTWLRLTVDGKRGAGFVLAPGAPHRVDAQRDLTIRTGDAGAISVSVAGRPAAVMGSNGRVMSRQYVLPGSTTEEHAEPTTTTGTPSRTASLAAALSPEPVRVVPQPSPPLRLAVAPTTVRPVVLPPAAPAASARGTQAASDSDQITTAARRWLAAYTGGDRRAVADLTAPGFELLDERPDPARFAANQQAERSLANAEVSVSGDGAVLSARLIERLSANDGSPDRTAYMSQVWIRQAGSWRLLGVRIRSADQVERMFKR